MAEEINVRVKHKGMTSAEWKLSPVILLERELGVATDTGEVRVGNGTDKWSALPIIKGAKGDQGKSVTVSSKRKDSRGNTVIEFSDGETVTIPKGDKGDSITVSSHKKDRQGNTIINFSDGSNVTVDKGDSIKVESTSTDSKGNTLVKFSDGSSATIAKGEKGDPLKFEDLTQEQINQIKAKDVDMSGYATKDDLASVDVSEQLKNYATKEDFNSINNTIKDIPSSLAMMNEELSVKSPLNHTHEIADVNGLKDALDGKASSTHTHDEYFKKGDPIELTPSQKAELKGERGARGQQGLTGQAGKGIVNIRTGTEMKYWAGSQADYNRISTKDPNTVYDVWE